MKPRQIGLAATLWTVLLAAAAAFAANEVALPPVEFPRKFQGFFAKPQAALAAEFETHAGLLLPARELVESFPRLFGEIVKAARGHLPITVVVADRDDYDAVRAALRQAKLPADAVSMVVAQHDTMWLRDYGPLFLHSGGKWRCVDADYGVPARVADDLAGGELVRQLKLPLDNLPLELEGGNLLSGGDGLCLASTRLLSQNAALGRGEEQVRQLLAGGLGLREVIFLEPLVGESTGHVDMFAMFLAKNVVAIGQVDPQTDPLNASVLDRNAARLATRATSHGQLKVVRVPMPSHADGIWRTYTNGILANGVLLMPSYPGVDADLERTAMQRFARHLPSGQVIPLDASELILRGGALHCLSLHLPVAVKLPPVNRRDLPERGRQQINDVSADLLKLSRAQIPSPKF